MRSASFRISGAGLSSVRRARGKDEFHESLSNRWCHVWTKVSKWDLRSASFRKKPALREMFAGDGGQSLLGEGASGGGGGNSSWIMGNSSRVAHNRTQVMRSQSEVVRNLTPVMHNQTQVFHNLTGVMRNRTRVSQNSARILQNPSRVAHNLTRVARNLARNGGHFRPVPVQNVPGSDVISHGRPLKTIPADPLPHPCP